MKTLLIALLVACTAHGKFKHKEKEAKILTGHFVGGNCAQIGSICGDWYIKPDSTFFYISIVEGNITSVGKGKVIKFIDSTYTFQFSNSLRIPGRQVVSYTSYSKPDYDSLYIKINVERRDKQLFSTAPMIFLDSKFLSFTDKQGKFESVMPWVAQKLPVISIQDRNLGTDPIEVPIDLSLNYHEIKAVVPGLDSSYCDVIGRWQDDPAKLRYEFPICRYACNTKSSNFKLQFAPDKSVQLISTLKSCKSRQPYLSGFIDDFITAMH